MREARLNRGKRKSDRLNSFLLKKPNSNGPLKCGGIPYAPAELNDKRLREEVKRLGWDDKFAKEILNLRRNIFDGGSATSASSGQVDSVNLDKKSDVFKVSMNISRWHVVLHANSTSRKKRSEQLDELKRQLDKHLPDMDVVVGTLKGGDGRKKNGIYESVLEANFNKPDHLCEGNKNVCKVSPPEIRDYSGKDSKTEGPSHGC